MKTLYGHAFIAFIFMFTSMFWLVTVSTFDLPINWLDYGCGIPMLCAMAWFGVGGVRHALKQIPLG